MTVQYYADSDVSGNITAFYNDDIWDVTKIPTTTIKITQVQWQDCLNNQGKYVVKSGALALAPTPSATKQLSDAQTAKKSEVSVAVGAKIIAGYQSYITLTSTNKKHFYGTKLDDQQNMGATRQWSRDYPTRTVQYRPQDALLRVDHTRDEFVRISDCVFDFVNWYLDQGYAIYRQIYDPVATITSVNAIVVSIKDPAPTVPTGLTATAGVAGSGKVDLSWTANTDTGLRGYNVYVDNGVNPVNTSLITGTTFSVTGLVAGTHTFTITADIAGIESVKSASKSATLT